MLMATANVLQDLEYYLPDKQSTKKIAQFFAVFADCSRLRLRSALAISPLCVSDIASILEIENCCFSLPLSREQLIRQLENENKTVYVIALNESAEGFYKHIGFEEVEKIAFIERKNYV